MIRRLTCVFGAILFMAATPAILPAAVLLEIGDAPQTITPGLPLNPSGQVLTNIIGNMEANGADIYPIWLMNGVPLTATTTNVDYINNVNTFDSVLILFNSLGMGLVANDDDPSLPPQSTLTYTPLADGLFYLAITGNAFYPTSAGGLIFPVDGFGVIISGPATGPGGGQPLNGWTGGNTENTGDYNIALDGAFEAVPEPSTMLLLGCGLLSLAAINRKR